MPFSDEAWHHANDVYKLILEHPFNTELAAGTLDRDRFVHYMQQDWLYLIDFGRALSLIAGRIEAEQDVLSFINFAYGAIAAERELHQHYFDRFDVESPAEKNPACFAYTHFLRSTAALEPVESAVAAVLPCFWIYREVGNHIAVRAANDNPYQKWIDTYSDQEFSDLVDQAITVFDRLADQATEMARAAMDRAFRESTVLEWHFWDDAYHQRSWDTLMKAQHPDALKEA